MELRHLRYFVVAAEEENFNKAAARLNMAQPALSRQMRDLELDLGVSLFERGAHRIRLSAIGRLFLEEARKVLAQAETARTRVQRANRGHVGVIRVGFNRMSARHRKLPVCLSAFRSGYPEVELKLSPLLAQKQLAALQAGEIDAGFFCFRPPDDPQFDHLPFAQEKVILAMHREHPLAGRREVTLEDLQSEAFVYFPRSYNPLLYDHVIGACMRAGLTPRIVQETITEEAMLSLASVGMGVSFVGSSLESRYEDQVVFKHIADFACSVQLELVWLRGNESATLKRFVACARGALQPSDGASPA